MNVIKPDTIEKQATYMPTSKYSPAIFLAGSIEMGKAEDWQSQVQTELSDIDVTIFNPRRDDWDSSWIQRETNPEFNHQVNWELDHLERSDIIFMYFAPDTMSPISLLELGMFADSRKMIICCPTNFWRRGNVEIVCSRFGIPLFNELNDAIASLKSRIKTFEK